MANNYWHLPKSDGASHEEKEILSAFTWVEVVNATKISRSMYFKFKRGDIVAAFVRDRIMKYVHEKSIKLNNVSTK